MMDLIKSDAEYVPDPAESPEPAVKMAQGTHFPFDWNGWGIGVEPGESVIAWQRAVCAISKKY